MWRVRVNALSPDWYHPEAARRVARNLPLVLKGLRDHQARAKNPKEGRVGRVAQRLAISADVSPEVPVSVRGPHTGRCCCSDSEWSCSYLQRRFAAGAGSRASPGANPRFSLGVGFHS